MRCDDCHAEKLVAFNCKTRGFYPSCGARRMAETAALLADEVLPARPLRQWVLSLPHALRFLLGTNPHSLTPAHRGTGAVKQSPADPAKPATAARCMSAIEPPCITVRCTAGRVSVSRQHLEHSLRAGLHVADALDIRVARRLHAERRFFLRLT